MVRISQTAIIVNYKLKSFINIVTAIQIFLFVYSLHDLKCSVKTLVFHIFLDIKVNTNKSKC